MQQSINILAGLCYSSCMIFKLVCQDLHPPACQDGHHSMTQWQNKQLQVQGICVWVLIIAFQSLHTQPKAWQLQDAETTSRDLGEHGEGQSLLHLPWRYTPCFPTLGKSGPDAVIISASVDALLSPTLWALLGLGKVNAREGESVMHL